MWKASKLVALAEVISYSCFILWSMIRAGSGSGVWIPLIPIGWFITAISLWIPLRLATFLTFSQPGFSFRNKAGFGGAAMIICIVMSFVFLVLAGFNNTTHRYFIWVTFQLIWQLIAVLLSIKFDALASAKLGH